MIERVARALCEVDMLEVLRSGMVAHAGTPLQAALATPAAIDELWPNYAAQARAAIEATREPTISMYDFGTDKMWKDRNSTEVWQSMIDAALQG